ncbi:MAG: His/Gly/Thr/Pro-type tRNA ligase C-terminal domain-containing protein [Patescibacteria group bacterium]
MMEKVQTRPKWALNEFDKSIITATYFGFMPIASPRISEEDIELTRFCGEHPHYDAAEKAAVVRYYLEQNLASLPHPLALVYKRKKPPGYSLHFIGAPSGIAEATLIRAALSMLGEVGYEHLRVDINCVGDRDSMGVYERELGNFVKKFGTNLSERVKQELKEDIFNLFRLEEEEAIQLRSMAPSSVSFLSTQSRLYFKEVLEYLEALDIEFRLASELVGEKNHASHTIFAIKSTGQNAESVGEETLAVGYRYSRLGRRLGLRKEVPMAGINIFTPIGRSFEKKIYKQLPRPKFYLVQLGREAKIKTLSLIELLRLNRIPVHHFLGKDKLTVQLSNAENLRVSYLIIIGQKEALDGTATVRNVATRAQDTIPLGELPQYLKHIALCLLVFQIAAIGIS